MSSEVQSRPAATRGGRGATRGGRGGFAGRGSTRRTNGDAKIDDSSLEDEGEIGQLKKLYGSKTTLIREMFPDWSEVDVLFALRETDGDENETVTRIAEGTISQWDEVSKPKKERTKPKATTAADAAATRQPRREGAGPDKTRGRANARAPERGGRSARGRSAAAPVNGTRADAPLSVPTEESQAWDGQKAADESTAEPTAAAPAASSAPTSAPTPAAPAPKTWASMLRQTVVVHPPKVVAKPKEAAPAAPKAPAETTTDSLPTSSTAAPTTSTTTTSSAPTADAEPESATDDAATPVVKEAAAPDVAVPVVVVPEVAIAPSKDALTESNLEQVTDDSHPPETDTLHSETADSWDPRAAALAGTSTPISASQQHHAAKTAAVGSGYAATASKATDRGAVRTPSYSRRILDQEEAVRMPVNRDVDRTAVQFGALNFNGADNEDIDGDREEPETRTQPPEESPVAHPRASLPPVAPPASSVPDAFAAQKQAPAAASNATPTATSTLPSAPAAATPVAPPTGPAAQTAAQNTQQQYGRFGQPAQESAFGQKPYDSYGQPAAAQANANANSQYDNYQGIPTAAHTQAQQAPTAFSSAAPEYSQYFTSDAQNRMPQGYNNYYQAYGQQAGQGHQDGAHSQRSYGTYDSLSQYPQSSGASRFGSSAAATSTAATDAQNSGTSTPNPPVAGQAQNQQQQGAGAQGQHSQLHNNQYGSYAQQHPYFNSPYYAQYMQYGGFGNQNYGPGYGGKGGYGNTHQPYNLGPQYDQSNQGGFGSSLHRGAGADNSALGSAGLSDYGRLGAGQSAGFGGAGNDSYGRGGASAYQSQAAGQGYGAQQSQVGSQQTGSDDLKPYGDASKAAGAGPNAPGLARPGSATNTPASQSLPPPQSSQQGGVGGYGGYPSHLQHGGAAGGLHGNNQSATGGAGGYGGNQNHGNNPYAGAYGGYNAQHSGHGGQGFGSNHYGNQQQRGWGGNYH